MQNTNLKTILDWVEIQKNVEAKMMLANYLGYNIYGSQSSEDYDIMIFLKSMPEKVQEKKDVIEYYNFQLSKKYLDKPVQCHLATMNHNNELVELVSHGTNDEVNNAIFATYNLHSQEYPCFPTQWWNRCYANSEYVETKIHGATRCLLSFFSRTDKRAEVKLALKKGNILERVEVLKQIDFSKLIDFQKRNGSTEYIYKTLSFQLAQTIALINDKEIFTKEEAIEMFPLIEPFIKKSKDITELDLIALENTKKYFIAEINKYNFKSLYEITK